MRSAGTESTENGTNAQNYEQNNSHKYDKQYARLNMVIKIKARSFH